MDGDTIQLLVWLIADIGALNWGLQEVADVNLVTELIGSGNAGIVYIVVGVAGALALADTFDVLDLTEI